ncbi:MAG TPA: hypothetical protein VMW14_01570 [Candidatus Paceibacterota bacterium]|nr:hypothetical protein [Candidatus Paceibacterota bacterium]
MEGKTFTIISVLLLVGGCTSTQQNESSSNSKQLTPSNEESIIFGSIDTDIIRSDGSAISISPRLSGLFGLGPMVSLSFIDTTTKRAYSTKVPCPGERSFALVLPKGEYRLMVYHPTVQGVLTPGTFQLKNLQTGQTVTSESRIACTGKGNAVYIGDLFLFETSPNVRFRKNTSQRQSEFRRDHPLFQGEFVESWAAWAVCGPLEGQDATSIK